ISFRPEIANRGIRNLTKDYIYLDECRTLDAKTLKEDFPLKPSEYYCTNDIIFSDFLMGLISLRISITKWFKKNGINDLNIFWENKIL
ncbi:MAG: hypothetical protein ABI861_02375, partial [Panacibacter sp.]